MILKEYFEMMRLHGNILSLNQYKFHNPVLRVESICIETY